MDGDGALSHFASCRTRHVRAKLVRRVHRLCACLHRLQYANGRFLFQALLTFSPVSVALPALAPPQHQATRPTKKMAPCHLAWLFLRDPEQLEKQEKQILSLIRKAQKVELAYGLAQQFVTLLKERNAQPLSTWLRDCQMSGMSDLVTFAQGLAKEGSALHAAFTLPYSNGPVEGKINKLKYIKRSMYGRGGFPLLRQRVLKAE